MRNSRWAVLVVGVAVSLVVMGAAGCGNGGTSGGDGGSSAGDNEVIAEGFAFSPATLEVSVGDTVTWTNRDSTTHTVEIDGEDLGTMGAGESLTWTADTAGTYDYLCTIHPAMTGTIVVK